MHRAEFVDVHREGAQAAFVRGFCFTAREIDIPCMQRASDAVAVHNALRERAALMWTMIEQREHLVLRSAKNRDIADFAFEHAAAKTRNLRHFANTRP